MLGVNNTIKQKDIWQGKFEIVLESQDKEDKPKSIEGALDRIRKIGALLNKEAIATQLITSINEQISAAKTHQTSKTKPRILFVFVHGGT